MAVREVEDIFADIIDRTKTLDPANARKWFDKLTVLHLDGGSLGIGCPDEVTVQFLQDNCKSSFTRAAQHITGHLVTIDFGVGSSREFESSSRRFNSGSDGTILHKKHKSGSLKLHPDYTFDNFVVGPSNRLAHASCVAVSQSPGNTYNPLFIYGNSGLGKTHLLHAVCFEAQRKSNGAVMQFLSCEDFVNRFIRAIEEGDSSGFQSQFRTVDMLVIDDVQFLREREHSQEEFSTLLMHFTITANKLSSAPTARPARFRRSKHGLSADLTGVLLHESIHRAMRQELLSSKKRRTFEV